MKLRSTDVWAGIDQIAMERGLSTSGLALAAGLDPTTFNKSKRVLGGHERWPSSSSIARVLDVMDVSLVEFAEKVERSAAGRPIPKAVRRPRKDLLVQPGTAGE